MNTLYKLLITQNSILGVLKWKCHWPRTVKMTKVDQQREKWQQKEKCKIALWHYSVFMRRKQNNAREGTTLKASAKGTWKGQSVCICTYLETLLWVSVLQNTGKKRNHGEKHLHQEALWRRQQNQSSESDAPCVCGAGQDLGKLWTQERLWQASFNPQDIYCLLGKMLPWLRGQLLSMHKAPSSNPSISS